MVPPARASKGGLSEAYRDGVTILEAVITCPLCDKQQRETMPEDACRYFYRCEGCGETLKPRRGDCCVFCSYGDATCPPKQSG